MGKLGHGKIKSSSSSPSPLPMRKRLFPLEIQRFAAKSEAKAGYGHPQGSGEEHREGSLQIPNCSSGDGKTFPNSFPAPQAPAAASTRWRSLRKGESSGTEQPSAPGPDSGRPGERGPGCSPPGRKSSSLARLSSRPRIAQARLEPGARSEHLHVPRESGGKERHRLPRQAGEETRHLQIPGLIPAASQVSKLSPKLKQS